MEQAKLLQSVSTDRQDEKAAVVNALKSKLDSEGFRSKVNSKGDLVVQCNETLISVFYDPLDPMLLRLVCLGWLIDSAREWKRALELCCRLSTEPMIKFSLIKSDAGGLVVAVVELYLPEPCIQGPLVISRCVHKIVCSAYKFTRCMREQDENDDCEMDKEDGEAEDECDPTASICYH